MSQSRASKEAKAKHKKCVERACELASIFDNVLQSQIDALKLQSAELNKFVNKLKKVQRQNDKNRASRGAAEGEPQTSSQPRKLKKPLNPYMRYCTQSRDAVKREYKLESAADVTSKLASLWREMSAPQRAPYEAAYHSDLERYREEATRLKAAVGTRDDERAGKSREATNSKSSRSSSSSSSGSSSSSSGSSGSESSSDEGKGEEGDEGEEGEEEEEAPAVKKRKR